MIIYNKYKANTRNIIDENIATCLYTGLVTDTGNFVYSSTHPSSFEMAKELLYSNVVDSGILFSINLSKSEMLLIIILFLILVFPLFYF